MSLIQCLQEGGFRDSKPVLIFAAIVAVALLTATGVMLASGAAMSLVALPLVTLLGIGIMAFVFLHDLYRMWQEAVESEAKTEWGPWFRYLRTGREQDCPRYIFYTGSGTSTVKETS